MLLGEGLGEGDDLVAVGLRHRGVGQLAGVRVQAAGQGGVGA